MTGSITKAQISKIWALARALGLDTEALYLLVPRGSISRLTKAEASVLIEHLSGRSAAPLSAATLAPSPEQRHFIYFLFGKLGWLQQPARVRGFLTKFFHADSVESIPTRKKAGAVIEALKAIYKRRQDCKT